MNRTRAADVPGTGRRLRSAGHRTTGQQRPRTAADRGRAHRPRRPPQSGRTSTLLRGPEQLDALHVLRAEYDNVLAALRHLCDTGGALGLAVDLTWYWQMLGRHPDAAHWLGAAVAVPADRPGVEHDIAEGLLLLSRTTYQNALVDDSITELRALNERLLAHPELPGFGGALIAVRLAALPGSGVSATVLQRLVDGPDVWLAGLAHLFRAQFAEN